MSAMLNIVLRGFFCVALFFGGVVLAAFVALPLPAVAQVTPADAHPTEGVIFLDTDDDSRKPRGLIDVNVLNITDADGISGYTFFWELGRPLGTGFSAPIEVKATVADRGVGEGQYRMPLSWPQTRLNFEVTFLRAVGKVTDFNGVTTTLRTPWLNLNGRASGLSIVVEGGVPLAGG